VNGFKKRSTESLTVITTKTDQEEITSFENVENVEEVKGRGDAT